MGSAIRVFRADVRVVLKPFTRIVIWGSSIALVAGPVGQLRAHRFPNYRDLAFDVLLFPVAFGALALLLYLAAWLFPVKLLADGVRCYDTAGAYQTIKWSDVTGAEVLTLWTLKYLVIKTATLARP